MTGTTHLTRLRTRMLATAYSNADFWARRWAFLTDQAVGALARSDPAAAETLAASLLAPEFLHDTQILGAAVEAGIDTSHWEERREKARAYAREAHELPPRFDSDTEARRLWASLFEHYKPIAAALAGYLRELPPTWQEDLFTPSPDSPAVHRPDPGRPGPETAPYDVSWEDCPACLEAQDQCRYHAGVLAGMEYQRDLITTALTDHTAIDQLQQRHAEREASAAQTAAAATSTPATA
ncbi:hypothetical protein ACFXC9_30215 [Streptomyces naganishii]|uniref:hypothetical protein n=1 Tax=Streptomyces naganishii TaxID=285447 RepID=UPI0036BF69CB